MQDTTEQSLVGFPSQKNNRRKGSGSSDDNTSTRKIKLQTSFPPIHLSLISNSKALDKKFKDYASNSDLSKDTRGDKFNLPHVEKAATPKPTKTFLDNSKSSRDFGCSLNNLASVPTLAFEGAKDSRAEKPNWLEVSHPKTTSERLSPEVLRAAECQTCKNERRMRTDQDKVLLQAKRDNEALQLRVSQLEAELLKSGRSKKNEEADEDGAGCEEQPIRGHLFLDCAENNSKEKSSPSWEQCKMLEKSNREKQEHIVELLSQLERTNAELEKLRKKRSHVLAEEAREKDCFLLEIEKLTTYCEKMKVENLSLSDTVKALQKELEKRSSSLSSQVYTAGAEVLLISHGAQEKGYTTSTDYSFQEICSCGHSSSSCNKNAVIQIEEDVNMREIYRQMKRERNLLLDVMVIMYERRWFVDEAIPYVRRALRKCGAQSAISDSY